jgi:hypothetical protein
MCRAFNIFQVTTTPHLPPQYYLNIVESGIKHHILNLCTSTSLFTGCTFYLNLNNFHEYLIQHSLKSGSTKDHFRRVEVPGIAPYIQHSLKSGGTKDHFRRVEVPGIFPYIQHSLKSGGTKDHFRRVEVPGTAPY